MAPSRLRHALDAAAAAGVERAVIDTPPRSETAALEAARAADLVVLPCRPQLLDLETLPAAQQLLGLAGEPRAAVVLTAVPPRGRRGDQARRAVTGFGLRLCPEVLVHRAAWGDAAALGLVVTEFAPRGLAAAELRRVAAWVHDAEDT